MSELGIAITSGYQSAPAPTFMQDIASMVRLSTTGGQACLFWKKYQRMAPRASRKYLQLREALARAIDDGFWSFGE
jgi:hypothetical protein